MSAVIAKGQEKPPAPIIDKAKRASYLTGDPVQRRENGRFTAFFALFIVVTFVWGAHRSLLTGERRRQRLRAGRNRKGRKCSARL
jgi:hypothetical protein